MVFSSFPFLFGFLPVVLALCWGSRLIARPTVVVPILAGASLWFFGYWDWFYLPLLLGSIVFNFTISWLIYRQANEQRRRWFLILGIAVNLLCLGYFKYSTFVVSNLEELLATRFGLPPVLLPIGISFYTFTQIAFLVDIWRDRSRPYGFGEYTLFVTIFPHLVAGPIIHHKEMIPQFRRDSFGRFDVATVNTGLVYFVVGLAKKVLVADNIALLADPVFAAADGGEPISFLEGWAGTMAYAMQLYFDFSGYADMAIGLGLMLGVRLPQNFNLPYRASSIADFWRRWHITLSRFLRDYLYIPLGGNRHGFGRELANLMTTMVLGGLWHGAGWTFLLWGALHGFYLVVQRVWQRLRGTPRAIVDPSRPGRFGPGWLLTMLAVLIAWVPFRATTLHGAIEIWQGMGLAGATLPEAWKLALGHHAALLERVGISFGGPAHIRLRDWASLGPLLMTVPLLALFLPRTEVMAESLFGLRGARLGTGAIAWRAMALGFTFVVSLIYLSYNNVFLYFQF